MIEPPSHPGLAGALGEYQVLRLLGAGGMSLVMLARDTRTGALVAIKMLRPQLVGVERATRRFLGEARHMRRLEHPNVLRVLEVCEREEGPYFVLPYMRRGEPGKPDPPGRTTGRETDDAHRPRRGRGAELRARARHHPSRHQAEQRSAG
jgi:serine/threonine protein kinase